MMLFSQEHIWLNIVENIAKVGISDYAQNELGTVMFINLPELGDRLAIGEQFGDVESLKTVSELISPLCGSVITVNDQLVDNPDDINAAPYDSWLLEVQVESYDTHLMGISAYKTFVEAL